MACAGVAYTTSLVWKDILWWKHEKWTKPMDNLILWTNSLTSQHKWRGIVSSELFSFFRHTVLDSIWICIWINFIIYFLFQVEWNLAREAFFFSLVGFKQWKYKTSPFGESHIGEFERHLLCTRCIRIPCITCRILYPVPDVH